MAEYEKYAEASEPKLEDKTQHSKSALRVVPRSDFTLGGNSFKKGVHAHMPVGEAQRLEREGLVDITPMPVLSRLKPRTGVVRVLLTQDVPLGANLKGKAGRYADLTVTDAAVLVKAGKAQYVNGAPEKEEWK